MDRENGWRPLPQRYVQMQSPRIQPLQTSSPGRLNTFMQGNMPGMMRPSPKPMELTPKMMPGPRQHQMNMHRPPAYYNAQAQAHLGHPPLHGHPPVAQVTTPCVEACFPKIFTPEDAPSVSPSSDRFHRKCMHTHTISPACTSSHIKLP